MTKFLFQCSDLFRCFDRFACADFRCRFSAPGESVSRPFSFFCHSPCLFVYVPLNYPLKSPLCAHSPNFPPNTYTRTENLPFFKSVPYQDYNEGLVPIPDLAFFLSSLLSDTYLCHVALDSR